MERDPEEKGFLYVLGQYVKDMPKSYGVRLEPLPKGIAYIPRRLVKSVTTQDPPGSQAGAQARASEAGCGPEAGLGP